MALTIGADKISIFIINIKSIFVDVLVVDTFIINNSSTNCKHYGFPCHWILYTALVTFSPKYDPIIPYVIDHLIPSIILLRAISINIIIIWDIKWVIKFED